MSTRGDLNPARVFATAPLGGGSVVRVQAFTDSPCGAAERRFSGETLVRAVDVRPGGDLHTHADAERGADRGDDTLHAAAHPGRAPGLAGHLAGPQHGRVGHRGPRREPRRTRRARRGGRGRHPLSAGGAREEEGELRTARDARSGNQVLSSGRSPHHLHAVSVSDHPAGRQGLHRCTSICAPFATST